MFQWWSLSWPARQQRIRHLASGRRAPSRNAVSPTTRMEAVPGCRLRARTDETDSVMNLRGWDVTGYENQSWASRSFRLCRPPHHDANQCNDISHVTCGCRILDLASRPPSGDQIAAMTGNEPDIHDWHQMPRSTIPDSLCHPVRRPSWSTDVRVPHYTGNRSGVKLVQ